MKKDFKTEVRDELFELKHNLQDNPDQTRINAQIDRTIKTLGFEISGFKEKLIEIIETYLLRLHTQPNDSEHIVYGQGWKGATAELIGSIRDDDGYVSKELKKLEGEK